MLTQPPIAQFWDNIELYSSTVFLWLFHTRGVKCSVQASHNLCLISADYMGMRPDVILYCYIMNLHHIPVKPPSPSEDF